MRTRWVMWMVALGGFIVMPLFIVAQKNAGPINAIIASQTAKQAKQLTAGAASARREAGRQLAVIARQQGTLDAALIEAQTALDKDPKNTSAKTQLIVMLSFGGEWDKVISLLKEELDKESNDTFLLSRLEYANASAKNAGLALAAKEVVKNGQAVAITK